MRKVKEKISGNYDLHIKWQLEEQRITAEIVSIKLNNVSRDTTKIFLDKISKFFWRNGKHNNFLHSFEDHFKNEKMENLYTVVI